MNLDIYNKVEQFVIDSFNKAGKTDQIKHFIRTMDWLKILRPDADEALLIAAVAHDIERAFRQQDIIEKKITLGFASPEFYQLHEERGAKIIADFLKLQNINDAFIERVEMLVFKHEEGGNDDQNLLKDADSISFFENNVSLLLEKKSLEISKEKVREKFNWMFNRITFIEAKKIAQPFYEKASNDLNIK